jgi:hypothetical protein
MNTKENEGGVATLEPEIRTIVETKKNKAVMIHFPIPAKKPTYVDDFRMCLHSNYGYFNTMLGARHIHVTECARVGLREISKLTPENITIAPILVNMSDLLVKIKELNPKVNTSKMTFEEVMRYLPREWSLCPSNVVYDYVIRVGLKHIQTLKESDVILFGIKPFLYENRKNTLAFRKGRALTEFHLYCHPTSFVVGDEKILLRWKKT